LIVRPEYLRSVPVHRERERQRERERERERESVAVERICC